MILPCGHDLEWAYSCVSLIYSVGRRMLVVALLQGNDGNNIVQKEMCLVKGSCGARSLNITNAYV